MKSGRCSLCLNKARKNLATNLDRSPLMRSYGYASVGDRSTLFASFSLSFVPSMQFTGSPVQFMQKYLYFTDS